MMKTEYERFIAEVRKQMAVQDITQVEAAKRIRADRGNLNQQISGRHKGMRAQTMFDLAKLLKISLDQFIEEALIDDTAGT